MLQIMKHGVFFHRIFITNTFTHQKSTIAMYSYIGSYKVKPK